MFSTKHQAKYILYLIINWNRLHGFFLTSSGDQADLFALLVEYHQMSRLNILFINHDTWILIMNCWRDFLSSLHVPVPWFLNDGEVCMSCGIPRITKIIRLQWKFGKVNIFLIIIWLSKHANSLYFFSFEENTSIIHPICHLVFWWLKYFTSEWMNFITYVYYPPPPTPLFQIFYSYSYIWFAKSEFLSFWFWNWLIKYWGSVIIANSWFENHSEFYLYFIG